MSYTILNTDGTTLTILPDGQVDQYTTSLTLIGKNTNAYGAELNNNFITVLANSANTVSNPPRSPLTGQLWYDTTNKRLKVYDNGFTPITGATVSSSAPNGVNGDLWFDTSNGQLKVFTSAGVSLIGPANSSKLGNIGWYAPSTPIKDNLNNVQQVSLLQSYGITLGLMSSQAFTMSPIDYTTYLNSTTTLTTATTSTVVSGLTVFGDINYTGHLTNKYLSLTVELGTLTPVAVYGVGSIDATGVFVSTQNNLIVTLLTKMFPPASSVSLYHEAGVSIGTEARVAVGYTELGGISAYGYQIRRFWIEPASGLWKPYPTGAAGNVPNLVV